MECVHHHHDTKRKDGPKQDDEAEYEQKQPWFHNIDRETAIKMLKDKDWGTFVVRPSSIQGHFAISAVSTNGKIGHYLIHRFFPGFGPAFTDTVGYVEPCTSIRQYICRNPGLHEPLLVSDFKREDIVNFAKENVGKRRKTMKAKNTNIFIDHVWNVIINELVAIEKPGILALSNTCSSMYSIIAPIIERSFTFTLPSSWWLRLNLLPTRATCSTNEISLPPSITHLTYTSCFTFSSITLPSSLTHLTFGNLFNHPVQSLPQSLTHLTFGNRFNNTLDVSSCSLKYLFFGEAFNQPVPNLPPSLKYLEFGRNFDQQVDTLPPSITHLTFGHSFNQPVDTLPTSLTHLIFGEKFNQPTNYLPAAISHLTFGLSHDQPIARLPRNITNLVLGHKFSFPLNCACNLKSLSIGNTFNQAINILPASLNSIVFGVNFNNQIQVLPPNLTKIIFGKHYDSPISSLPTSLTHLYFGAQYNKNLPHLPSSLQKLVFGTKFNCPLDLTPCLHLRFLSFGHDFDAPLEFIPSSITVLTLHSRYRYSIPKLNNGATLVRTFRSSKRRRASQN